MQITLAEGWDQSIFAAAALSGLLASGKYDPVKDKDVVAPLAWSVGMEMVFARRKLLEIMEKNQEQERADSS